MRNRTDTALPMSTAAAAIPIAREDRPGYDAAPSGDASGLDAPIAVLLAGDRDDVVRNLRDAEAALREVLPELVLALNGIAGAEFLINETAQAMGRLSMAARVIEDRLAAGPPNPTD